MNDYMQVRFDVEPCSEMATDVLAAVLAEIGYESFVPDERGVTAFVPQGKYDEIRLKEELSQYPIGGVSVAYEATFVAEEIIDTGNEAFRLVQAYVGITEELASDVGPGHDVRVIERDGQAGVSERPQCHVEPGQTCQHLRTGSARADKIHCYRVLRVNQVVVDIMHSFHFSMSFSFKLFNGLSSSRSKGLSFAAFVTRTRFDLVGLPCAPRWENSVSQNFLSQYSSSFA